MREDLVDSAPDHDIAAQKELDRVFPHAAKEGNCEANWPLFFACDGAADAPFSARYRYRITTFQ